MRISILTPDFSGNRFGRAWLLAKLLQTHFDVEIVGPAYGDGIWMPFRNACDFDTKLVKGFPNGRFELKKILDMISGEVVYASKPLMPSFGVGIIEKIKSRKPLVLDIDDWELGFGKDLYDALIWPRKIYTFIRSMSNWQSYSYALILNRMICLADQITVSGGLLQAKYGGTIVWHTRDFNLSDEDRQDRQKLRSKHLPKQHQKKDVIAFIGTARPHKGLEDLFDAIHLLNSANLLLMVVGVNEDAHWKNLKDKIRNLKLEQSVILFPEQSFSKLSEFLSVTDVVVIPQRKASSAFGQVPAKLFDAMAMGKPVVSTNVYGIPEILNGCAITVEPENPKQLADAINYMVAHPREAQQLGKKALEKYNKVYEWDKVAKRLHSVFTKILE